MMNKILGIWDGHDSGAALIQGDKILFAVNEERLTRRKLEIAFPAKSVNACLRYTETSPDEISDVAVSTSDFAKTLARVFPSLKEEYYLIRRRKKDPKNTSFLKKKLKYKITEYPPSFISRQISGYVIRNILKRLGFSKFRLHLIDHHLCHAATAAFCSGFDRGLIITLDGLGDGLSGSVYRYENNELENIAELSARHSLGIFFEHVTNLMNMRELEDEGKVMALANYAYPVDDAENPLMDLIRVKGLSVRCRYSALEMYDVLKRILWRYPPEQFACMAQRTLEVKTLELVQNALKISGSNPLCLAGGLFSNVKVNRLLRLLPGVNQCFVFPHMGDGGLPLGAALTVSYRLNRLSKMPLDDIYLGPPYSDEEIEAALKGSGLFYKKSGDIAGDVAKIIADGGIVFWFQGRMELGPRALGNRSILARPDSEAIKDALNLRLKKRVWYQPFCPSMLEEEAKDVLSDYDGYPNPFMTMAYMVREDKRNLLRGVINVDGSCRPQIAGQENPLYEKLLRQVKSLTGRGILLNTSFNLHGEPVVCSPEDAVKTMISTGNDYMAMGNFWVTR
jgi:carbamoyltransferase